MAKQTYAPTTASTHPGVEQIARCIEYLRSVCDGAHSRDYQGFSAFDKNLGWYLAEQLANFAGWTRQDLGFAVDLVWKYREQLWAAKLQFPTRAELQAELVDLGEPAVVVPTPTASTATVTVWRDGEWLSVAFSHYDHTMLGQLMATVPQASRWWDEERVRWLIAAEFEAQILTLYGVELSASPEPLAPPPPPPSVAPARPRRARQGEITEVTIEDFSDDRVSVRVPFELKDTLKAIVPWKSRAWDGPNTRWLVDRAYEADVRAALGGGAA